MADDRAIRERATRLVAELSAREKTVATAESCTGGWIAKAITDVAGSSAVLGYGIVSYSDEAKQALLDVQPATLAAHGAVSEATVREMAAGALAASGADIAVAVSGVAGPGGGSDDKPVGTVWFGWALRSAGAGDARGPVSTGRQQFDGDREEVRRRTVVHALDGVITRMTNSEN